MTKSNTLVSYCVKRIAPAAAALVLALTGGSAFATPQQGAQAVLNKLQPNYIPTNKATVTIQSAKEADLLLAIELALADGSATPEDIAAGVLLENTSGKTRSDKDKIAPKILATIAASAQLSTDAKLKTVFANLYEVNGVKKTALSATGKGNLIAAAVKVAGDDTTATSIGTQLAASFTSVEPLKDLATLLQNTSKAFGKTLTAEASENLESLVKGLLDAPSPDVAETTQLLFIQDLVKKVASSNPAAAGAFFGGVIQADPDQAFSTSPAETDASLKTIATFAVTPSSKASKAVGEILAQLTAYTDKKGLAVFLSALSTSNAKNPLIAQGLIRASDGLNIEEVKDILDAFPAIDPVKFAASAVVGSADDDAKLTKIISTLAAKPALDVKKKTSLGLGAISAVGGVEAASAKTITAAIFASGGFVEDSAKLKFGTDIISKIKAYPAAGQVAAAIVDASANTSNNAGDDARIGIATALMAKASKAGSDIALQVAFAGTPVLPVNLVTFADKFADGGIKFLQPIAMGLSLADPNQAGFITAKVINHNGTLDKSAISKAVTIAGAVAGVVDEEKTASIANELSKLMTITPVANDGNSTKPLKFSTINSLATALAKAVQNKPGVILGNRMDELGELAATLVANVIGQVAPAGTNPLDSAGKKLIKTENSYITGIGTAIIKTLSKTLRLSGDPTVAGAAKDVAGISKLSADLWEASDIAGSIARVIKEASTVVLTEARKAELLGTDAAPGLLEVALLKVSGSKTSLTYAAVQKAFRDVRDNIVARFEPGFDPDVNETTDNNG